MKISILLLAGTVAACVAPAAAETMSVPVNIGDLDLASVEGRAALNHRIDFAVRQICGEHDARDLSGAIAVRRCTRQTRAATEPQIQQALATRTTTRIAIAR